MGNMSQNFSQKPPKQLQRSSITKNPSHIHVKMQHQDRAYDRHAGQTLKL